MACAVGVNWNRGGIDNRPDTTFFKQVMQIGRESVAHVNHRVRCNEFHKPPGFTQSRCEIDVPPTDAAAESRP